ncbi:hypothetical protein MKX01_005477 [Papaver californicum]|nr:hypothetical protein MKX01_005477 [Papaver californicum]
MIQQFVPRHVADHLSAYMHRIMAFANPYMEISFDEFTGGERLKLSQAYSAVEAYLGPKNSEGEQDLAFSMNDYEEIIDDFEGVKIWWSLGKTVPETKKQAHTLYSNNANQGYYEYKKTLWSHVEFEHPVTFDHLAMDPAKKQEIIDGLVTFCMGRDYYQKIGKPWKRGYLLYGPPGTGKSSMIAAMAKLLNYDIYDLELTAAKDNSELKKLLQDTSNKSITVIEDVDCSLDLTGKRKKKKKKDGKDEKKKDEEEEEEEEEEEINQDSKVTLSGLLNVIDWLWSACGKERIVVFTTNYVEKLDPALIRRGQMDKLLESLFAKNYLGLESHELFDTIRHLIDEVRISPADVAEILMPKTIKRVSQVCLQNLIKTLEKIKEDEKLKAEEGAKKKENDGNMVSLI